MRIGILCPSEIAYRRFLPAIRKIEDLEFIGLGVNSAEERYGNHLPSRDTVQKMMDTERQKAEAMTHDFGGKIFGSYQEVVTCPELDAVYIPLPPALHFKWALEALQQGKHVLVEKPATVAYEDTLALTEAARRGKRALHENYMFIFHEQMNAVKTIIDSGELGEVRLYRINFGFPRRAANDFRYDVRLGGGALLDAGGYTIKCAEWLLGVTADVVYGKLNYLPEFHVDMYGSGALINDTGVTAQIAFGMDNDYKCELEVWGSKGTMNTGRILTAPAGFIPTATIRKNGEIRTIELPADDAFRKSVQHFIKCAEDPVAREKNYEGILRQARLVGDFMRLAQVKTEA